MLFCRGMLDRLPGTRTSLATAGILLLLLAVIATLQYRWIGEVSEAERDRMRTEAVSAATRVAGDFDREITRVFFSFEPPPSAGPEVGTFLADSFERWASETLFPGLVAEVLVAVRGETGELEALRADFSTRGLLPVSWPAELETIRARLERGARSPATRLAVSPDSPRPGLGVRLAHFGRLVVDEPPAVIVPRIRPAFIRNEAGPEGARGIRRVVCTIVRLDRLVMTENLLPHLVRRHFGSDGDFDVAVLRRAAPTRTVYVSRPQLSSERIRKPDAEADLFALRLTPDFIRMHQDFAKFPAELAHHAPEWSGRPVPFLGGGAWRLVASHRAGSLEAAVAAVRRRNLAVGGGILVLLAATVAALMMSAQRARRLGRQQVEFVTGITHELRTPLAAIRSAGQNLADGTVAEPQRVKHYGALVEREGRRLTELIERTLVHAGLESGWKVYRFRPLAVAAVVDEAIAASHWLSHEKEIRVEALIPSNLPLVLGDFSALRTLVENLVSNAIKYGRRGSTVTVRAREDGERVELTVEDRGPGIRPEDLSHIFEPFYRGRDVSSGSVPGSGLGLSIVRRIAKAHGGEVHVKSQPGEGSAFRVRLPAELVSIPSTPASQAAS